jgi:hypothetical protein
VTVAELIEELKKFPSRSEVYVYEFGNEDYHDSERDPMLYYDDRCKTWESSNGELVYPHGRVKL